MSDIACFPPIVNATAERLILGSMPGRASLAAGRYYAHPRNLFWPILGELIGAHPALDYTERTAILAANRIALWDVLKSCRRNGSLDAAIDKASAEANDFAGLLAAYPRIRRIYFNGKTAELYFRRHVAPSLSGEPPALHGLPSTSPAYASLSFEQKLQSWRAILETP